MNHTGAGHISLLHEELAKLRFELDRQSKEMELKLEKMTEYMENMHHHIDTQMETNAKEEAYKSFVGARHTATERIETSDGYLESYNFANAQHIQEVDFGISNSEEQSARKTTRKSKEQKGYDWWNVTNREMLTTNSKDRKNVLEPGKQNNSNCRVETLR